MARTLMHKGKRKALNQRRLQEAAKASERPRAAAAAAAAATQKPADMYEDPGGQPAEMNTWKYEQNAKEPMGICAFTCQDSDPDLVVVVR